MLILDSHSMKDLLHVLLLDPFKKISTKIFRCFCFLHKQQKKKKATRSDSFVFVYFFPRLTSAKICWSSQLQLSSALEMRMVALIPPPSLSFPCSLVSVCSTWAWPDSNTHTSALVATFSLQSLILCLLSSTS